MPDWSYHPMFKPWLSRLPGNSGREFIHRGMSLIASMPGGTPFIEFLGHMGPSEKLTKDLFGFQFRSPVGFSGKIDPQLTGMTAFPHLGFGFIEVGPVTTLPITPDQVPFLSKDEYTISYPIQRESIGVEATIRKLNKRRVPHTPILIRLNDFDVADGDVADFGDIFIINADSMNSMDELAIIKQKLNNKPVLLAIQHNQAPESLLKLKSLSELASGVVIDEESYEKDGVFKTPMQQTAGKLDALKVIKKQIDLQ